MRSELLGEFEGFMIAICVDESLGNYEMRFGLFNPDIEKYTFRMCSDLNKKGIRSIRSKSLYLFIDEANNYMIDKRLNFSNLIISREDRIGGELEEEVYNLFNAYHKIKDSLRIWIPELIKFDDYLSNFGIDDLTSGKTDALMYDQFERFSSAVMEKKNKLENKVDSYWGVIPLLKEPLTKTEITDLMLDDILKLKDYVKESNEKEINKYSRSIRNYSKILKYDLSGMLEKIIKNR